MHHRSLPEMFFSACEKYAKADAVLVKKAGRFEPLSSQFFRSRVEHFARGLISLGVQAGETVALMSETRFEWVVADMGILAAGAVCVPVYPSVPEDQLEFILNDAACVAVVAANAELLARIQAVRPRCPRLKTLISMDERLAGEEIHGLHQVELRGVEQDNHRQLQERMERLRPEHTFTIVYTSGTTGMPKGVVLSHGNMLSNIAGVEDAVPFHHQDTCLSHLPLSHVLERMGGYYLMIYCGVSIAFAESMKTVAEDLMLVKPSVMISVPRLFEKIYARIVENTASAGLFKRKLVAWAMGVANRSAPQLGRNQPLGGMNRLRYALADRLVFSKIRARTGGRLRYLISGGAPLSKEIGTFFLGVGIRILEGYGLTETTPVLTVNRPRHIKIGTVGPAIQNVELRIAEDGEILAKGPNIMKGYHNNAAATAEVFDNGWFKTGDIGEIDADGYLRITDRKKELIVTSGGKNIAPQPIEGALKLSPYIEQVVVLGDKHNYLTALIVPPWESASRWAGSLGLPLEPAALAASPAFHRLLEAELVERLKDFARYEQVKKFTILTEPFTEEGGELTPSLKLKRRIIAKKYAPQIEAMYQVDEG